ncbi:MAG: hypothetical protein JW984_13925 [Deltaproteobacteria bacterium]|uniref:Uncharacterized protein n=1 Tax=Candidatus Zymogenus saltonus TaxID=2844893 RepID=A0A9D8PRL8_9DELT|nr:hypothetical protein [Candidatus Zymogenus saltonus]
MAKEKNEYQKTIVRGDCLKGQGRAVNIKKKPGAAIVKGGRRSDFTKNSP